MNSNPVQTTIRWYFDFISPFAYLQFHQLQAALAQRPTLEIEYCPVLFAGLLGHHQHKGPAEIPAKRQMTYRYCHWYARKLDIPFNMPAAHPFNPLPFLRMAIALDCAPAAIAKLYAHVWVNSADDPAFAHPDRIAELPGFEAIGELTGNPTVKEKLKANTDHAIGRGIFGVPTIEIDDQLFWGMDMTDMAFEFLDQPNRINDAEYQRLGALPVAKAR